MKNKNMMYNWRFLLISFVLFSALISIVIKIFSIQFFDSNFLKNEGDKKYIKYEEVNPVRGSIFDRNNFPLAISIVNYDLYALKGFKRQQLLSLAEAIDIDINIDNDFFTKKTLIKKDLSKEELLEINKINLKKFEIETRHSRHYPLGDQIATLVGFYGKDGAQEGLEKSYDNVLSGIKGKKKFYKNAKQEVISKPIEVIKSVKGEDIQLTIDATIQFFAYKYLAEAIKKNKAKAGTVIILDNQKGEILAMASYPSYNPNHPQRKIQKNWQLINLKSNKKLFHDLSLKYINDAINKSEQDISKCKIVWISSYLNEDYGYIASFIESYLSNFRLLNQKINSYQNEINNILINPEEINFNTLVNPSFLFIVADNPNAYFVTILKNALLNTSAPK